MTTKLTKKVNTWFRAFAVLLLLIGLQPSSWGSVPSEKIPINVGEKVMTVSGQVTSAEDGTPLIGVTIVVKGVNTGTVTDVDGRYSIEVEDDATLVFTYTGFEAVEVPVNGIAVHDVTMKTDVAQLGEVIVVGTVPVKSRTIQVQFHHLGAVM